MKIKVKDLNGPLIFFLTREMSFWRYELWNLPVFRPVPLFCQRTPKNSLFSLNKYNPEFVSTTPTKFLLLTSFVEILIFKLFASVHLLVPPDRSVASWSRESAMTTSAPTDSLSAATLLNRPCPPPRSPTRVSPWRSARRFDQLVSTFIRFLLATKLSTRRERPEDCDESSLSLVRK